VEKIPSELRGPKAGDENVLRSSVSTGVPAGAAAERSRATSFSVAESKTSRQRKVTVREASFHDYAQVAALQLKYGLQVKGYEEWKDLWLNNPAYKEHQNQLPMGWVLKSEKQEVLGYLGNIPLIYELDGRRLLASVAHAWVVEADYRSYSLLLLQRYFSQKVVDLFLNATVGPLAVEAFAVFESLPVPVGTWDQSAFWITNYHGFFANWLAVKNIPLANPLSYVLGGGLFLKDTLSARQVRREHTLDLHQCTHIDSRFDDFWQALRKVNSTVLMGVRSQRALEWHFGHALQQNNAWIVTAGKGSDITAYAIFQRQDSAKLRLRRMRLVDFQTLDRNTPLLEPMLSWALERCRNEGIHMLECIGLRAEKQQVINKSAPHMRKLPCWMYYYKTYDQSLAKRLDDPNVWDPSQFDGDASL
jgi:hypothetical protein